MKTFINNNSKIIVCSMTLIICVTIVCVTNFSYAANNESGTIYTRDELSELVRDVTSEVTAEKSKTSDLQNRTSILESDITPLITQHSEDIIKASLIKYIDSEKASIHSYLDYSIIGKILIIDIGGLSVSDTTDGVLWMILPTTIVPRTNALTTVTSATHDDERMLYSAHVYNFGRNFYIKSPKANVSLWGQLVIPIL